MLEREQRVDQVDDKEMAALFRFDLARCDKWLEQQSHIACLKVDYRQVVSDPQTALSKIVDFLGGELDLAAMCGVVDVNLYRNRRSATTSKS
jgi:hypothetical protein